MKNQNIVQDRLPFTHAVYYTNYIKRNSYLKNYVLPG